MQLDEYGAAARGVQFVDYPRNERERTVMLNERSDARDAIIALAASEDAALGIIAALGLDNDDELLNMAVAEPVPSDASPVLGSASFGKGERVRVREDADNTDAGRFGDVITAGADKYDEVMVVLDGDEMGQFIPAADLETAEVVAMRLPDGTFTLRAA